MDLHLIKYFVAVVDYGGVTKAARELYISQPSLSQAIRSLERRLGVDLFDRSHRTLQITEAGRIFDSHARRVLADADKARAAVDAVRTLKTGRLDLVAHSSLSVDPLVPLVARFRITTPGVIVNILDTDSPLGVINVLRQGEAEIGITDLAVDLGNLRAWPIDEQELIVAATPELVECLPNPIPSARAAQLPLAVDRSDKALRAILDDLGGAANVVIDCEHATGVWNLVAGGSAATIMSRGLAEQELPGVQTRSIEPPLRRTIGAVARHDSISPAAEAFLVMISGGN